EIKTNQYVVPSSIRIIEPEGGAPVGKSSSGQYQQPQRQPERISSPAREPAQQPEPVARPPMKMAFVSEDSMGPDGESVADYGNFKVVKQVKGKSLLIDPSLENDPARDNIIAQVLEMLNKYN